jgi:hypothetical protein
MPWTALSQLMLHASPVVTLRLSMQVRLGDLSDGTLRQLDTYISSQEVCSLPLIFPAQSLGVIAIVSCGNLRECWVLESDPLQDLAAVGRILHVRTPTICLLTTVVW